MPATQYSLGLEVMLTEAQMRAVYRRTRLAMSFERAMQRPAVARCIQAAARAAIAAKPRRRAR